MGFIAKKDINNPDKKQGFFISVSIGQDKIDQVRQASDIVEVVSTYVTLQHRGKNYFGLCPFHHEKTPSFSVNPELQIFHCFGCGAGGNVFTFIMRMDRLTFPESVRRLAKAAGILLPEENEDLASLQEKEALFYVNQMAAEFFQKKLFESDEAESARSYLQQRGITKEEWREYWIGYAPNRWNGLLEHAKELGVQAELLLRAGLVIQNERGDYYDRFRGRVAFAIHNLTGQVVAFGCRRLIEDSSPKYINSPETDIYQKRLVLYGLHWGRQAMRDKNAAVILEGYTDLISMRRVGVLNVVASAGTALTEEHSRLLRRYTSNAFLLYDGDAAGASASLRGADVLLANGLDVRIGTLPSDQDPDEFARSQGRSGVEGVLAASVQLQDFKLHRLRDQGLLATPGLKATAVRDLLATVAKMSDPLQKSFYVRDLAEKLQLEEPVLWQEVRKQERTQRTALRKETPEPELSAEEKYFQTRRGAAELALLDVVLKHPDLASTLTRMISFSDFTFPEIRELFQRIEMDVVDGAAIDPARYIACIRTPHIATSLSQSFQRQAHYPNPLKFAFDCIKIIRMTRIDERIEEIRHLLKEKDQATPELLQEYQERIQERQRIHRSTAE